MRLQGVEVEPETEEQAAWLEKGCVRKEGGEDKLRVGRGQKRDVSDGGREKEHTSRSFNLIRHQRERTASPEPGKRGRIY